LNEAGIVRWSQGIYLPEFGVRSQVNGFVDGESRVHVTAGKPQTKVLPILAMW
jgi:Xaa-Pro dipeptidase